MSRLIVGTEDAMSVTSQRAARSRIAWFAGVHAAIQRFIIAWRDPKIVAGAALIVVAALPVAAGGPALADGWFGPPIQTPVPPSPSQPTNMATGDLNGDGVLDVVTGCADGQVRWYLGTGDLHFVPDGSRSVLAMSVDLGDLDGDDDEDLVVGGGTVRIYMNDGTGALAESPIYINTYPYDIRSVCVEDLDEDGYGDLVAGGVNGFGIFWGTPDGPDLDADWYPITIPPCESSSILEVEVGRIDNDALDDILLSVEEGAQVCSTHPTAMRVYLGMSNRTFGPTLQWIHYEDYGNRFVGMALGDIDGDGYADLFADRSSPAYFYQGNGSGSYATAGTLTTPGGSAVALADLDENGTMDAVWARVSRMSVHSGSGPFLFQMVQYEMIGLEDVVVAELDGNTGLDLIGFSQTHINVMPNIVATTGVDDPGATADRGRLAAEPTVVRDGGGCRLVLVGVGDTRGRRTGGSIWVRVMDPSGREVSRVSLERSLRGYEGWWGGRTADGARVNSGVYLLSAREGSEIARGRVVVVQ